MSQPMIQSYDAIGILITAPVLFLIGILIKDKKFLATYTVVILLYGALIYFRRTLICGQPVCFNSIPWHLRFMSLEIHSTRYILPYAILGLFFGKIFDLFKIRKRRTALGIGLYILLMITWIGTGPMREAMYLKKVNQLPPSSCKYDDTLDLTINGSRFFMPSPGSLWFNLDDANHTGQNPNIPKDSNFEKGYVDRGFRMSGPASLRFCEKFPTGKELISANSWSFSFVGFVEEMGNERYKKICNSERAQLWPKDFCSLENQAQRKKLEYPLSENCQYKITKAYKDKIAARKSITSEYCADSEKVVLPYYPDHMDVYLHTRFDDLEQKRPHTAGTTYRLSQDKAYMDTRRKKTVPGGIDHYQFFVTKEWKTPNGEPFAMDCYQLKKENYLNCMTNFVLKDRIHITYDMKVNANKPLDDAKRIYDNVLRFVRHTTPAS